jgi:CBS domain-containing protein
MRVKDVMNSPVITIGPSASIAEAARLMLDHKISGLPVVDEAGRLRGIVTEGDFLRRAELGTETKRPRWLEYLMSTGRVAQDYVLSHGREVAEVMHEDPVTCGPEDALDAVVDAMLRHQINRLPVIEGGRLVGIVARADLLRALATLVAGPSPTSVPDWKIAATIETQLRNETWGGSLIEPSVKDGVVILEGKVFDKRQQEAIHVLVENVPGVKSVVDHLLWIEPRTGTILGPIDLIRPEPRTSGHRDDHP